MTGAPQSISFTHDPARRVMVVTYREPMAIRDSSLAISEPVIALMYAQMMSAQYGPQWQAMGVQVRPAGPAVAGGPAS